MKLQGISVKYGQREKTNVRMAELLFSNEKRFIMTFEKLHTDGELYFLQKLQYPLL